MTNSSNSNDNNGHVEALPQFAVLPPYNGLEVVIMIMIMIIVVILMIIMILLLLLMMIIIITSH